MLEYVRWVMVRKRDEAAPPPGDHVPRLPTAVEPRLLGAACPPIDVGAYDFALAGSPHRFGDYQVGEKIDHVDGITVEEAEHQIATRLYQNTARIHFDQFSAAQGRFGRRLIYGGHVISLARALSFNGLANAFHIAAINGGRHVAPLFAGETVFAWSEVLAKSELPGRSDVGALRLRTVATKDRPCADFPYKNGRGLRPRRAARSRLLGADPAVDRIASGAGAGELPTALAAALLDHAAGDAVAGVAGRIALVVVGLGVDHERRAVVIEHRVRLALLQRDRRIDHLDRRARRSAAHAGSACRRHGPRRTSCRACGCPD